MTDSPIPPALTPEGWKGEATDSLDQRIEWSIAEMCDTYGGYSVTRHSLAALALYGQPFGFTHEDVDLVLYGDDGEDVVARRVLAAKIAALLPPQP